MRVRDAVAGIFQAIDATPFGRFVKNRSQSFVAINSSIADIGYMMYAFTAGAHLSAVLVCGMACKLSGSILLLADDKKGAAASRENRWPSRIVLALHHAAKAMTLPARQLMPGGLKRILPNAFTAALSLYALNGAAYFINGCLSVMQHAALTHYSQTAAGVTMMLGGMSFAISGLEKSKGVRETVWSKRGQYCYAVTPIFCAVNLYASVAAGQGGRSLALALVTSMAIFQIYVRHNFKRQRPF